MPKVSHTWTFGLVAVEPILLKKVLNIVVAAINHIFTDLAGLM
jgi:hypothetical protein